MTYKGNKRAISVISCIIAALMLAGSSVAGCGSAAGGTATIKALYAK